MYMSNRINIAALILWDLKNPVMRQDFRINRMLGNWYINFSSSAFIFWIFNTALEKLYLIKPIYTVVINRVAIGGKNSLFIPVPKSKGSNPKHFCGIFNWDILAIHNCKKVEKKYHHIIQKEKSLVNCFCVKICQDLLPKNINREDCIFL